MSSLNKVMIIGHVGADPRITTFDGGRKIASFTIATTEKAYTLQNGTQVPERTEWHNIIIPYTNMANAVEKYIHKGDMMYIEGKIRTRSYEDKQNVKRYITEVYAEAMQFLQVRPTQQPQPQPQPAPIQHPQQVQQPQQTVQPQQQSAPFPPPVNADGLPY